LAEKADTPQRFQRAERELQTALRTLPRSADVQVAMGVLYFRRGKFDRAAARLENAMRLGNYEEKALFFLGQSYLRLGRLQDGKKILDRYQQISDESRAIQHLENRILHAPDDLAARLRLAKLYRATGQLGRARFQLNEMLQRQPEHKDAKRELSALEKQLSAP
jgi:predicted Zn-dependent protease